MIHGILFVQFTSLTVLSDNLSPGPLWSSSWPWTLNFILDAFLHPIIIIFSFHRDLSKEKVKKKRISGEAYDMNKQTTHTPI